MTDEERSRVITAMKKHTNDLTSAGSAVCRQHLIDTGIYTPEGQLAPQYGGPGWVKWLEENRTPYTRGPTTNA